MRRPIWICVYPQQSFREAEGSTADVQFYPGEPSMAIGLPVGWRSRRGVRHLPRRPQLQVRRAMLTTTRKPATVGEILVEEFMRSEEHTSELQSLMRISYAVFCL